MGDATPNEDATMSIALTVPDGAQPGGSIRVAMVDGSEYNVKVDLHMYYVRFLYLIIGKKMCDCFFFIVLFSRYLKYFGCDVLLYSIIQLLHLSFCFIYVFVLSDCSYLGFLLHNATLATAIARFHPESGLGRSSWQCFLWRRCARRLQFN